MPASEIIALTGVGIYLAIVAATFWYYRGDK
jgi:hypothetical protein